MIVDYIRWYQGMVVTMLDLLTVRETAQLLRVSPLTVRRYIASGQLAAVRVGRLVRIRREAAVDLLTPIGNGENSSSADQDIPTFSHADSLWNLVGLAESDGPTDVSANVDAYLADAHASNGR